jgi:hypothetical protein
MSGREARRHRRQLLVLSNLLWTIFCDTTRNYRKLLNLGTKVPVTDLDSALLSRDNAYREYKAVAPPTVIELWYFLRELFDFEPGLVDIIKSIMRPRFQSRECKTTGCALLTLSKTGWCSFCRKGYGLPHWPEVYGCGRSPCSFRCYVCKECECRDNIKEWGTIMGTCERCWGS